MPRMLFAAVSLTLLAGLAAADPAAPLRDALAAVPQVPDTNGMGPAFADAAAAAQVLAAMDLSAYDPYTAGPLGPLALAAPLGGDPELTMTAPAAWPALVGFGPADIAGVVNYGTPPDDALRLVLRPGVAAGVPAALAADGYAQADTPFGPLFLRGEQDYAISLGDRNPDDPFGGSLGQASRVLVQGDVLIRAAGMPALEAAMNGPFWGDRGDLAAILEALSALPADSVILRAQVLTDQTAFMGGELSAAAAGVLDGSTAIEDIALPDNTLGIPPWSLGLMADVVTADKPAVLFAFVYATELQAREAAARATSGWQAAAPVSGRPPAETIGPATIAVAGGGPFVLTLTAAGDWPAEGMLTNLPFRRALGAFYDRDLAVFGLPF